MLQSGHNIEKVREKMRELTKQIVNLCSASRSFPYILEGLRSKNNRTRIECVDVVGFIIDHHGAEVKLEVFGLFLTSIVVVLLLLVLLDFQFSSILMSILIGTDYWTIKITANCCELDIRTRW